MDGEFTVDASSAVMLDGDQVPVANALELADALAASPVVHQCYLQHWIEFANGRPLVEQDVPLAVRLGGESIDAGQSIKELVIGLVTSRAFLSRAAEELP